MMSNNSEIWTVHVYFYTYCSVNRYPHGSILVYVQSHTVEYSDITVDPCMFIYTRTVVCSDIPMATYMFFFFFFL